MSDIIAYNEDSTKRNVHPVLPGALCKVLLFAKSFISEPQFTKIVCKSFHSLSTPPSRLNDLY